MSFMVKLGFEPNFPWSIYYAVSPFFKMLTLKVKVQMTKKGPYSLGATVVSQAFDGTHSLVWSSRPALL